MKLDILINGQPVDALSVIIHKDKAYYYRQPLTCKMKDAIPRQLFEVVIQAAIGNRVIARDRSSRSGRTLLPSATAETSPGSGSCWKSRRKGRSG